MISPGNTGQGFPLVLYSAKAMTSEKDETTNSNYIIRTNSQLYQRVGNMPLKEEALGA